MQVEIWGIIGRENWLKHCQLKRWENCKQGHPLLLREELETGLCAGISRNYVYCEHTIILGGAEAIIAVLANNYGPWLLKRTGSLLSMMGVVKRKSTTKTKITQAIHKLHKILQITCFSAKLQKHCLHNSSAIWYQHQDLSNVFVGSLYFSVPFILVYNECNAHGICHKNLTIYTR